MNKVKEKVLFLCTHNSCRSQMAEGLLRKFDSVHYESYSAGVKETSVHPLAVQVMDEIGIDISQHYSKTIETYKDMDFEVVVTVCDNARETCPFFPGKTILHQNFQDPAKVAGDTNTQLQAFRETRDAINTWIIQTFSKEK